MDNSNKKAAPTTATLKNLKEFIIWAREHSVQLHELDFGTLKVTLTDLELFEDSAPEVSLDTDGYTQKPEPMNIYDEMARRRGVKV